MNLERLTLALGAGGLLVFSGRSEAAHQVAVGVGVVFRFEPDPRPGIEAMVGYRNVFAPEWPGSGLDVLPALGGVGRVAWAPSDGVRVSGGVTGGVFAHALSLDPSAFVAAQAEGGVAWSPATGVYPFLGGQADAGEVGWVEPEEWDDPRIARLFPVGGSARIGVDLSAEGPSVGLGVGAVAYPVGELFLIPYMGRPYRSGARGYVEPEVFAASAVAPADAERQWLRDGCAELASVSSFLRLERELLGLGAPAGLRARAREAARQEVGHALLAFDRARAHVGPFAVRAFPSVARRFRCREEGLRTLVVESLVDGVVGEGVAAGKASAARDASGDESERRIFDLVAAEEREHAILGRDIGLWCGRELARA